MGKKSIALGDALSAGGADGPIVPEAVNKLASLVLPRREPEIELKPISMHEPLSNERLMHFREVRKMWNEPSKERLSKMPGLYETEHVPLRDKEIHLHCFIAGCDWFIAEYDGKDLFWGFAILNNDYVTAEWGYVSFAELKSIKIQGCFEVDCELEEYWTPKRAIEIDKIRIAHGWLLEDDNQKERTRENELILKVKAGHFQHFQDLFAEVISPYSDFFGIDPYPIWELAYKKRSPNTHSETRSVNSETGGKDHDR